MTDLHQPVESNKLEVRFMRLGCGDDIVSWCMPISQEEHGTAGWFLSDPIMIVMEVDADAGKQQVLMMPWLPRGVVLNNECIIEKDEVICILKVEPDVEQYYKQLCQELSKNRPKVVHKLNKDQGKNVFGFDMKQVKPLKVIRNEKQEETPKANT